MNFQLPEIPKIPDEAEEDKPKTDKEITVTERINSPLLNEMIQLCFTKASKNTYTDEYKAFSYTLYTALLNFVIVL